MRPETRTGLRLLGLSSIALGAVLVLSAVLVTGWDTLRAQSWSETSCRIESVQVLAHSRPRGKETYTIEPVYSYSSPAGAMSGKRLRFAYGAYSDRGQAEAEADRYAPGASVPCYFDPANPADAVIDRSWDYGGAVMAGTVGFFVVCGVLLVALNRRS